jgi:hypothetical protein
MKIRVYSIFFLSVLTLYLIRPIIPFVEYAVNKDYIVKNLCIDRNKPKSCCAGKCHLKKELAKSDASSDNEGKNNSQKSLQKQISDFLRNQIKVYHPIERTFLLCILPQPRLQNNGESAIFVPPKNV